MSIFLRFVVLSSITFLSCGFGILYLINNDISLFSFNKEEGIKPMVVKLKPEEVKEIIDTEEDLEVNEEVETYYERRRREIDRINELNSTLGYKIENTLRFITNIPSPKYSNGQEIRTKEFEFNSIVRDPKFNEEEIKKLSPKTVINEFKEYLILANEEHLLWEVKARQLDGFLDDLRKKIAITRRTAWLNKKTTPKELAKKCHNSYLSNPRTIVSFSKVNSYNYHAIWRWCTLPQYWAQNKPKNWPI